MRGRSILATYITSVVVAGAAGFFLGSNYTRNHDAKTNVVANPTKTETAMAAESTPAPEATTTPTAESSPAASGQQYTVKKGDTLYSIGKQYNISWPALAKANNLEENSVLKEGQTLTIPSANEAKTIQAHEYTVVSNQEEKDSLRSAQDYANAGTGQLAYRLVPTQVVQKSLLLSKFSFAVEDLYVEKSKDDTKGEAVVEVTHNGSLYTVYLNQPLDKGAKGVWSPTKVLY